MCRPITFTLPPTMQTWVKLYLKLSDKTQHFLFSTVSGQPFSQPYFSMYFQTILTKHHAPAVFPPSLMRKIFVDSRMQPDAAPGPSNEQAAAIMGHSPGMWTKVYDSNRASRNARLGAEAMEGHRAHVLTRAAQQRPDQQLQAAQHEALQAPDLPGGGAVPEFPRGRALPDADDMSIDSTVTDEDSDEYDDLEWWA